MVTKNVLNLKSKCIALTAIIEKHASRVSGGFLADLIFHFLPQSSCNELKLK